ncbi:DUF7660 family protein [Noviherbaspirillum pedocola]|uniref:DUF7660 domain-containing protein n=1 Tax=Noviherbaspirillum pedocola TaxID=2801341 RepID=A0A934SWV9_9BURK|nr:hypothetical protein [Noviherbaspirillum pedocola]MBK4738301.1 hypothetical protein [Noviherbaspirillum pedocola]
MTSDDLFDYAKTVSSREGFVKFIEYLNQDYQQKSADWENKTLDQFLSGLSSFTRDMAGYYKNMEEVVDVEHITWRLAAEMLLAATVYGG